MKGPSQDTRSLHVSRDGLFKHSPSSQSPGAYRQESAAKNPGSGRTRSRAGQSREGGGYSPQVEEHVGLLVQNHLDVARMDQGVIHLVPLSIASLSSSEKGWL